MISRWCVLACLLAASVVTGCSSNKLDRGTALKILKAQNLGHLDGVFPGLLTVLTFEPQKTIMIKLLRAGVIQCDNFGECFPGPKGVGLRKEMDFLIFDVGRFEVIDVMGILETGPSSTEVEARTTFLNSPLYSTAEDQLLKQISSTQAFGGQPLAQAAIGRPWKFAFSRYDDGWRCTGRIQ